MRIGIITRRFWPFSGPVEMEAADVAKAISQAGHEVEILTIHWDRDWPAQFRFRDLKVLRFSRRIGGPWGMFRFLRDLNAHVRGSQFDLLLVYGLADESWAVLRNFVHTQRVGLRIDDRGWQAFVGGRFHFHQRRFLSQLARIWVDSEETRAALIQSQVAPQIVEVVPPCILLPSDVERSNQRKIGLRSTLSDAHPILEIEPHYPLVFCASSLDDEGIEILLSAWKLVVRKLATAKLWLLGEGRQQLAIWQRVCELRLADSVVMPGQFDQIEEVLVAADVYVHAAVTAAPCDRLARAMACGACVVSFASARAQPIVMDEENGLVAQPRAGDLAETLIRALSDCQLRARLGSSAQIAGRVFDAERWVDRFLAPACQRSANSNQSS